MKVFKFGGASVKDASSIRNVASIIRKYAAERLVIVVSAMGKTTNAIEQIAQLAYNRQ
jgi:aspartate kinase